MRLTTRTSPFTSLDTSADGSGTSLDYVFITGVGQAEDYTGIDVAGKVVFCSRGTTSFYEKAEIAVGLGAIATVVCNNQPGVINMDLTDYKQTAPCVSITQANAAYIKEHSTEAVTEGGVTYYTGTLTVDQKLAVSINNSPLLHHERVQLLGRAWRPEPEAGNHRPWRPRFTRSMVQPRRRISTSS